MSDRDDLIEELAGAHRPRDPRRLRFHPAFHDLDAEGRVEAHARAETQRVLEAALHPEGLSTTALAVLDRIRTTS